MHRLLLLWYLCWKIREPRARCTCWSYWTDTEQQGYIHSQGQGLKADCVLTLTLLLLLIWSTLLHTTAVPYNEQAVIVSTPAIQLTTYYPDMRVWEKLGIQIKAKGLLFCHSASPVASTTHVCKATPDHYALKNRLSRWLCNCAPGRALWPRAQGPAAAPRSPAECRAHLSASTPRVRETCASSAAHRAEGGLCAFHCYSARVLLWAAAPGVLCLTQTSCCPNWHAQGGKAGAQSGGGHGTDRTFPAAHFLKWACPPKPQQHSRSPGEALKPSRSPAVRPGTAPRQAQAALWRRQAARPAERSRETKNHRNSSQIRGFQSKTETKMFLWRDFTGTCFRLSHWEASFDLAPRSHSVKLFKSGLNWILQCLTFHKLRISCL